MAFEFIKKYFITAKCDVCGYTPVLERRWWQPYWQLCWGNHNKKITELEELKDLDVNDVILISDVDKKMSKKVTLQTLINYIKTK